ncbi:MAG: hypothetical protein HZB42_01965 [Sphingobacteriales bacterium]|nr:hypothetical protein [Sphingobacteriales bacterium]
MKSINLPPLFFLTNPLRAVSKNFSSDNNNGRSPYLKAILSGTARSSDNNQAPGASNDKEAALRYIKESKKLKK